tara:strand:+ start:5570 stop:7222 length:1653 start_codon:yes stop_codon:yes gene_type:complete
MIRYLSIKNLATVDSLEIEFRKGFTVLTGETGAGKSIVVGALGLLAGARAHSDLVRTGAEKATIQASVETDEGQEIILRREITAEGRSRAFINDALATIRALENCASGLVDIHGQHDHQTLLKREAHLGLLDSFLGVSELKGEVASAFRSWRSAIAKIEQSEMSESERKEKIEFLSFQCEEIDGLEIQEDEDERLLAERDRLSNAERLLKACDEGYGLLYEDDRSVLSGLGQVWKTLETLAEIDKDVEGQLSVRGEINASLEELAFFLRGYRGAIEASPERLSEIESRLSVLAGVKKKHGPRLSDVLDARTKMSVELSALEKHEESTEQLRRDEEQFRDLFLERGRELSAKRKAAAKGLEDAMNPILLNLALDGAVFKVEFEYNEVEWSENGIDEVEFFFSANRGEVPRPLAKVASGGELSRVMLAIKTVATNDLPGKTLIFDEVDAGIGGVTANYVGESLFRLSDQFQVLCVTHLPQIACFSTNHLHVAKVMRQGRTLTVVEELAEESRASEIARLMTGATSKSAIEGARELLRGKEKAKGESERRKRR